jgi:hypothetical protein
MAAMTRTERSDVERELVAGLQLEHLRTARLLWLRWLAASSVPAWLEIHGRLGHGLVAGLAFLIQGGCLVMAVCYTALETRCGRRAAQIEIGSSSSHWMVHSTWTEWDEVRSALWYGVALVSVVPWLYVGLARPVPSSLLSALTATVWTVLLLLATAESVSLRWPFRRGAPCISAPRAGHPGLAGSDRTG